MPGSCVRSLQVQGSELQALSVECDGDGSVMGWEEKALGSVGDVALIS